MGLLLQKAPRELTVEVLGDFLKTQSSFKSSGFVSISLSSRFEFVVAEGVYMTSTTSSKTDVNKIIVDIVQIALAIFMREPEHL